MGLILRNDVTARSTRILNATVKVSPATAAGGTTQNP